MGGRGSTSGAKRNFAIDKNLNGAIIDIEREIKFIDDLRNGRINTSIDIENQNKHIISHEWKNNVKQQMAKINGGDSKAQSPKSRLYANINPAELVEKYSGTGLLSFRKNSTTVDEFVGVGFPVGITFDRKAGKYVKTSRLQIRYQDSGVHVFPILER
ncbi:MAG: polymorphic toxin type 50 domain-containing protein [Oscillospiraceae bacterium]